MLSRLIPRTISSSAPRFVRSALSATSPSSIAIASKRQFSQSAPAYKFDIEAEKRCRELLDTLPTFEYLFQNEDGSIRSPSESELKTIAFLNQYSNSRKLSLVETFFSFPKEYENLYLQNDKDLLKLQTSSALIIDKIPFEDTATGEIKWKIVREGEDKEGWENIAHLFFIPAFVFLVVTLAWRDDLDVTEWAKRELLYRVKAKAEQDGDSEFR
ncbi:unnamed protein product [Ambrosiozyma monospora]|uniref:Unnamed protein product n=1 Tax=Ambrosiozyma monospora TaxID=43982 RepID=A0A9W6T6X8_AMBMO|nr:unnamed protein product [Ambrosiozyma monospora]